MTTCERCGLTIHGMKQAHTTADDCLRYLIPRYAAMEATAKRQAEYATRLEQRLERAQQQARAAEQACRAAQKNVKHERERTVRVEQARNAVYSSLLSARADAKAERRRYTQTLARMRKLAGDYLEDAA